QVRGYRVEPGEVEAALCEHPGVTGACVLGRVDATGSVALVGFYAAPAPIADLRSWLADRVPGHLVPAALGWRESLPVTPNGKVDRDALRTVDLADERPALTPAGSPTEYALAGIWRDVF